MISVFSDMRRQLPLVLLFNLISPPTLADINQTLDEETGLKSWVLKQDGLELTLKQAYPEQILAFYLGRGFPKAIATQIANSCMFQTIVKNTLTTQNQAADSNQTITIRQALWQVKSAAEIKGIKLKETWDKQWSKEQIKPASRIAFRWATFPTEQSFRPNGDYNWGMTCFDLKPGAEFDLKVVWTINNKEKNTWIHSLKCAIDTSPQQ